MLRLIKDNKILAEIDKEKIFFSMDLVTGNNGVDVNSFIDALKEIENPARTSHPLAPVRKTRYPVTDREAERNRAEQFRRKFKTIEDEYRGK